MSNLKLTLIIGANDRSRPIIDGTIKPDGIDLAVTVAHPSEIFYRQLHFAEFDVSEMSLSSLLMTTANGDERWTGLPIFTSRRFFHTGALVRKGSGIEQPADLKGRRVGVPEYQQTAALWTRGVFQHEFGVRPEDLHWFMERTEERSHGGATGFTPPPGVRFEYIPRDKSIASMLLSGELDAAAHYIADRNIVDRSWVDLDGHPDVLPLFPDRRAESARYYQKTGLFPINHGMVVRRSIHEQHPWVAINLFKAFNEAKELVRRRTQELAEPFVQTGRLEPADRKALASDPFPYGVKSNRRVLETICQYSHEQGLTPRVMRLEEIFAPATLDL